MINQIGELRKDTHASYQRIQVKLEPMVNGVLVTYQQCADFRNPGCWCKASCSTLDEALALARYILAPPEEET